MTSAASIFRALVTLLLLLAASSPAADDGEPSSAAHPMFNTAGDYTYMWWMHGVRDPRAVFGIQTGRFATAFDSVRFQLTHLTAGPAADSAQHALTQRNAEIFGRPNAALSCMLQAGGRLYRLRRGSDRREDCQLIESGRFFQRRMLRGMSWDDGAPLGQSEFEIAAWPDRLLLLLRVTAARQIRSGSLEISLKCDGLRGFSGASPLQDTTLERDVERGLLSVRTAADDWSAGEEKMVALVLHPSGESNGEPESGGDPLRVTTLQLAPAEADLEVSYNRLLGCHQVHLRNDGNVRGYHESSNGRMERVALRIENPADTPRVVRLSFWKGKGHFGQPQPDQRVFGVTGLSAMLRDARGHPTGRAVQISKNWHTKGDDRYRAPWYRGLTMLGVPAATTLRLEYTSVNAHFGGVPAASHAQLCLVGWGANQLWDQAAIGSWGESLCFEPDHTQRGGCVLDSRPLMVTAMGSEDGRWGWTNNTGGADFLRGKQHARMKCLVRRNGPVLTEVTYAGRSADETIELQYTVSLYRSDDVTRGVYRFRYDVQKPTEFDRLVWFQCGGDDYSYTGERKMAAGNEQGLLREWNTQWGGNTYRTEPVEVAGRVPWFSMHEAVPRGKGAWANRGLVLRHWDARIGGRRVRPWAAERGARVRGSDTSLIDLLPPPGVKQLQPGDYVEGLIEHIVVPQFARDYYGPNENLRAALQKHENTWKMIYREALGNDLRVEVVRGRLARNRPLLIRTESDRAEFSISGGLGYVPMTVANLSGFRRAVLEIRGADGWSRVDQSVHGNDFWQTDFDPATQTWQISYSVPLDTPGDRPRKRTFRFRLDRRKSTPD